MSGTNEKIDMSLDDIIRKGGHSFGRGRGRRGSGIQQRSKPGTFRRSFSGQFGGGKRGSGGQRFGGRQRPNNAVQHYMRKMQAMACRLMLSNLAYSVTDDDLYELFASFGPLKKSTVHYDQSGQSLGTAELVFEMRDDAIKAVDQYNGVPLDGRPMRISILDKPKEDSGYQVKTGSTNQTGFSRGRGRGRGGSQGQFRDKKQSNLTVEDLDKDLDNWRMETE